LIGGRFSASRCGDFPGAAAMLHSHVTHTRAYRYSNPSKTCAQISLIEELQQATNEYREFWGLNKRKFAFMPASEALQVRKGRESALQRGFGSFGCCVLLLTKLPQIFEGHLMYKDLAAKGFLGVDPANEVTWPWPLHLQEVVADGSQSLTERVHASIFVIEFVRCDSLNASCGRWRCTWLPARKNGCRRARR
jgi:hypothetical protein